MVQGTYNNDWKENCKKLINEQLEDYLDNKVSFLLPSNIQQLLIRWMFFFGPFLTVISIFLFILFGVKHLSLWLFFIPILLLLIGIILFIIVITFLTKWTKAVKLHDQIINKIDLLKIYQICLNHYFTTNLKLLEISTVFIPKPTGLIKFDFNAKVDSVFNLQHATGNFSFGTITHRAVEQVNRRTNKEIFYRLPIFTAELIAKIDTDFVLQPQGVLTKLFYSLDKIDLQDQKFQAEFTIGGHSADQIMKVLTLQVRKNLLALQNKIPAVPVFDIQKNFWSFLFQAYLIKNWNDKKMALANVSFSQNINNIANDIITKIEIDVIWMKECFTWLNQFEIIKVE